MKRFYMQESGWESNTAINMTYFLLKRKGNSTTSSSRGDIYFSTPQIWSWPHTILVLAMGKHDINRGLKSTCILGPAFCFGLESSCHHVKHHRPARWLMRATWLQSQLTQQPQACEEDYPRPHSAWPISYRPQETRTSQFPQNHQK